MSDLVKRLRAGQYDRFDPRRDQELEAADRIEQLEAMADNRSSLTTEARIVWLEQRLRITTGELVQANDRIEALEEALAEGDRTIDAFGKVTPEQYQRELAAKSARIEELEAALRKIACEHVTEQPLWWQMEARAALALEQDR